MEPFLWLQTTIYQSFNFNGKVEDQEQWTAGPINEIFKYFSLNLYSQFSFMATCVKIIAPEFVCLRIRSLIFHRYTGELFIHYAYCVLLMIYAAISSLLYILKNLFQGIDPFLGTGDKMQHNSNHRNSKIANINNLQVRSPLPV